MKTCRHWRRLSVVGTLMAIGFVVAGIAYAAIPDANNVIHGCVSKDGGLRVIDTEKAQACRTGEAAVNWNQAGPKGADGAAGATGPSGPPGPAGSSTPDRPTIGTLDATGQHIGAIADDDPIVGMEWGIVSPRDAASGQATGKRQHKPLVVTKELDATTPLFARAVFTNENLTGILIGLLHPGGSDAYLTIQLTNAQVASVHQFVEGGKQYEEITFTYQTITLTYIDGGITAEDDWEAPVS